MSDITTAARRVAAAMSRAEAGITIGFDQEVIESTSMAPSWPSSPGVTRHPAGGPRTSSTTRGDRSRRAMTATSGLRSSCPPRRFSNRLSFANFIEKAAKKMSAETRSELSDGDHLLPR